MLDAAIPWGTIAVLAIVMVYGIIWAVYKRFGGEEFIGNMPLEKFILLQAVILFSFLLLTVSTAMEYVAEVERALGR